MKVGMDTFPPWNFFSVMNSTNMTVLRTCNKEETLVPLNLGSEVRYC